MNNPIPSPDPDDEVVSAYLDGEASATERARVEASPPLLARVEALRSLGRQVSTAGPPALSNEVRDRHIAAALEASSTSSDVIGIGPVRERQAWYRHPAVIAAAAAIFGAVVAVPLASSLGSSDTGSASSGAAATDVAFDEAAQPAAPTEQAPGAEQRDAEGADAGADGSTAGDGADGESEAGDEATLEADETGAPSATTAARAALFRSLTGPGVVAIPVARYDSVEKALAALAAPAAPADDANAPPLPSDGVDQADGAARARLESLANYSLDCVSRFDNGMAVAIVINNQSALAGSINGQPAALDASSCAALSD